MIKIRLLIFMILASLINVSCGGGCILGGCDDRAGINETTGGGINKEINNPSIE